MADQDNDKVILLNSDRKWNRITCPAREETEEKTIQAPRRLCHDEEMKQLIVGFSEDEVNVSTLSRN